MSYIQAVGINSDEKFIFDTMASGLGLDSSYIFDGENVFAHGDRIELEDSYFCNFNPAIQGLEVFMWIVSIKKLFKYRLLNASWTLLNDF